MSKERKFHQLIEQQNREEKDRVWAKVQQKEAERLAAEKQTEEERAIQTPVLPKTTPFAWKKWAAVAASSIAVIFLGVFAMVKYFPFESNIDSSSGQGDRYFTVLSYETIETKKSLKEYAQENGKDWLYFDWYDQTDYRKNYVLQVNDTQEIICYNEEMVDVNTGCIVYLFVIEDTTRLESFSTDESTNLEANIQGTQIDWSMTDDKAYVNFVYEDYRYYLRIQDPMDGNYVLSLVEELLSK